ncbi:hypothetical protein Hdeb2414_s0011g00372451 [Helianthus debilis subsp. tardiflorus]
MYMLLTYFLCFIILSDTYSFIFLKENFINNRHSPKQGDNTTIQIYTSRFHVTTLNLDLFLNQRKPMDLIALKTSSTFRALFEKTRSFLAFQTCQHMIIAIPLKANRGHPLRPQKIRNSKISLTENVTKSGTLHQCVIFIQTDATNWQAVKRCNADSLSDSHNGQMSSERGILRLQSSTFVGSLSNSALQGKRLHFNGTHLHHSQIYMELKSLFLSNKCLTDPTLNSPDSSPNHDHLSFSSVKLTSQSFKFNSNHSANSTLESGAVSNPI